MHQGTQAQDSQEKSQEDRQSCKGLQEEEGETGLGGRHEVVRAEVAELRQILPD